MKTTMIIDSEVRAEIKILAATEKVTMGEFIKKIVSEYKEKKQKEEIKNQLDE